jgi:hypothetical protein
MMESKEMKKEQNTPKKGDIVEVRDNPKNAWHKRIFLAEIENIKFPFFCVQSGEEESFRKGEKVNYVCWIEMRPYTPFTLLCADGVTVTDPEQIVYWIYVTSVFEKKAKNCSEKDYFSTKAAAEDHLRNTARVLCLDDLDDYIDSVSKWGLLNEIVNHRLK